MRGAWTPVGKVQRWSDRLDHVHIEVEPRASADPRFLFQKAGRAWKWVGYTTDD